MELLYASSGDPSHDSPTADFSAPLLPPLSEHIEAPADIHGHVTVKTPDREQTTSTLTTRGTGM